MQLKFAPGDSGEIEQIVNQTRLQLDIATDHLQSFSDVRRQGGIVCNSPRPNEDRGKRGSQFMTKRGEETVFGGIGGFSCFLLAFQFLVQFSSMKEKSDLAAERFH